MAVLSKDPRDILAGLIIDVPFLDGLPLINGVLSRNLIVWFRSIQRLINRCGLSSLVVGDPGHEPLLRLVTDHKSNVAGPSETKVPLFDHPDWLVNSK